MAYLEHDGKQAGEQFEVRGFECDRQGCMRPSAILRYFQEMATLHCDLYGLSLERLAAWNVAFLLTRVRLHVQRPPTAKETVTLSTWHRETCGVQFLRDTVMRDAQGKVIASCTGSWVLVNRATHKISRPRDFSQYNLLLQPECALENGKAPALHLPKTMQPVDVCKIRYTDIDNNGHMNNCNYADFIVNFLPCSLTGKYIDKLDIRFVAEAMEGDDVKLFSAQQDSTCFLRGEHSRGICFESACHLSDIP